MAFSLAELYSQMVPVAKKNKTLLSAAFELTSRCNLKCKMCYVCQDAKDMEHKDKELTVDQWIEIAEGARNAGLLFLILTGGEVFLRKDFKQIYEKLHKMGFIITIYTNGTLITPEIAKWLASTPPYMVSITMYGASRETYEKVTGLADGYDRVCKAIDSLAAEGIRYEIKTVALKENKEDYDQLLDFARQRKLALGVVNYISPRREEGNTSPLEERLDPEDLVEYEVHINKRNEELGFVINDKTSENPVQIEDTFGIKSENNDKNDAFQCLAGKGAGWVTWDGRLLPCGLLDLIEAFPLKQGFAKSWEKIVDQCLRVSSCEECQSCEYESYCEHCPARLFKETGYVDMPAPYLCELAKKRKDSIILDKKVKNLT